jgi:hypothetical protein
MSMRPLSILGDIAAGILILLAASGAALAQESAAPPGRAAQLSYAEGSVALEPAGTDAWTSAVLNRPLTMGDRLWTDRNSRAELDIGDAVIRLGSMTGFSFLNLDDRTAQMQVSAGTVIVHVRSLASGENDEIDTPNLALTLEQPGTYRVDVSESGDTTIVAVDDGAALVTGGGQSFPVAAQQSVTFTGTNLLSADYAMVGAPDAFDEWSMRRDQEEAQQAADAQQYVSPDVVGASDLGSYGTWQETPDWGYVWFPAVAAGWAPYSEGSWMWISPWGWTWVDEEPWGFAPFHYGSWGYWHRRWCWIPEPRRKRAIFAPARVGWVGDRHDRGARVGWFPLGPRHARYSNSAVPGAVTVVPRGVFASARPVAPHRVILPHRGGMVFRASTAAPDIMPVRQSVLGVNAGRGVRPPPRAIIDRPVVARLAPPRAPVSFAREQAAMRANGGRPLPFAQLSRLRPNMPAVRVRLAAPPGRGRQGLELHTAPDRRGVPIGAGIVGRERTLQQPTLPPARAPGGARPSWGRQPPVQPGSSLQRPYPETVAPQRQAPLEWQVPPRRQAAPASQPPVRRFVPPPRLKPQPHFAPPQGRFPVQRFAPPSRPVEQPRFSAPPRPVEQPRFRPPSPPMPQQRFAPPPRPIAQPRFSPPMRQMPQRQFSPPSAPPPMARPPVMRAPEGRPPAFHPGGRPPRP